MFFLNNKKSESKRNPTKNKTKFVYFCCLFIYWYSVAYSATKQNSSNKNKFETITQYLENEN